MLDYILRAGDRVRMKMDPETRAWTKKAVEDGTLGTVLGRRRAENVFEERFPRSAAREPGTYSFDTGPIVQWDEYPEGADRNDPEYGNVDAVHLEPADTFFKEYKERYNTLWPVRLKNGEVNPDFDMEATKDKLNNRIRTGDLPETPFWELDIVSFGGRRVRITHIGRYGDHAPYYTLEGIDENGEYDRGGTTSAVGDQLRLIERGPLWNEAHGIKLTFRSLQEEVKFASNTGRTHSVRNPANNLYSWTMDEVLAAIQEGTVDGFTLSTLPFSSGTKRINAEKFNDRDLGERVRQETLKGFELIEA